MTGNQFVIILTITTAVTSFLAFLAGWDFGSKRGGRAEKAAREAVNCLTEGMAGSGDRPVDTLAAIAYGLKDMCRRRQAKLDALRDHHLSLVGHLGPMGFKGIPCESDGGECSICSILICPHHESLHLHHDGCPAEELPHAVSPDCGRRCRHAMEAQRP